MSEGQIISDRNKTCPACGKTYRTIVSKDKDAAVLRCACGHEWTAYYERPRPEPTRWTV